MQCIKMNGIQQKETLRRKLIAISVHIKKWDEKQIVKRHMKNAPDH